MKTQYEVSAGGIVYKKINGEIEWLIIQHEGKGHWGFPKGHIGDKVKDETKELAALREVQEEGGIEAKIISHDMIDIHYMFRHGETLIKKTVNYFLMEYISGDIADHDAEISDIKFASEEEIHKTLTFKSDKEAFAKALKMYKEIV